MHSRRLSLVLVRQLHTDRRVLAIAGDSRSLFRPSGVIQTPETMLLACHHLEQTWSTLAGLLARVYLCALFKQPKQQSSGRARARGICDAAALETSLPGLLGLSACCERLLLPPQTGGQATAMTWTLRALHTARRLPCSTPSGAAPLASAAAYFRMQMPTDAPDAPACTSCTIPGPQH